MRMVKRLAVENNQTILSTIHCPSTRTLREFDDLLLLIKGRTIYFGPVGDGAPLRHFASIGVAPTAEHAANRRFNVVEWLVELTGGGVKGAPVGVDYAKAYAD